MCAFNVAYAQQAYILNILNIVFNNFKMQTMFHGKSRYSRLVSRETQEEYLRSAGNIFKQNKTQNGPPLPAGHST